MARPNWTLDLIRKTFVHDMKKMRVTKLPVVGRVVESLFFKGDHLICLPKDGVISVDREVDPGGQMAVPSDLAAHFIAKAGLIVRMNFCICRYSMGCEDYPIEYGCLFLGPAAEDINPAWGVKVSQEEALEHLARCREAGLVHFIGKSKLDTVWLGTDPEEEMLTICNCCPCCCITRGVPYIADRLSRKIHRAPGVTVTVSDDCVGCGLCTKDVCFAGAITLVDGKAEISEECRGCGRCVSVCPNEAIRLTFDREAFMEPSVRVLEEKVKI